MLGLTFKLLLIFILAAFFNSSALAGGSDTFKSENESEQKHHQVKNRRKKDGPPVHAPAHGYRAKHQYLYYPSQKVYHDTKRGMYFYLKGDRWEVGASLPPHLMAGLGESVKIELGVALLRRCKKYIKTAN